MELLTSYLNNPLIVNPPEGVLRVQVCRSVMAFQKGRVDCAYTGFAPDEAMSAEIRAGRPLRYYSTLKEMTDRHHFAVLSCLLDTQKRSGDGVVILLCHEADPTYCHRGTLWEAWERVWAKRKKREPCNWSLKYELKSPYGGLAEVGE